jgi:nitrogenase molybdenum-iron protein alpha/beta subunit
MRKSDGEVRERVQPQTDEEILAVLEEEAKRLIEESDNMTDTKVQFVRKHVKMLKDAIEIKRAVERIEKKLEEKERIKARK